MNFFAKSCLSGLILASSSAMAVEPASGWYGGGLAGLSWAPSINFHPVNPFPPPARFTDQITYRIGFDAGLHLGYRCYKFRYEGEILFNYNKINRLNFPGSSITSSKVSGLHIEGYTDIFAPLFNVYYEFYDFDFSDTNWIPYIGLGIGYARVKTRISTFFDHTKLGAIGSSSNTAIGQAMLGVNYLLNDDMTIGSDIRYLLTQRISTFHARASAITWNLVFNYSFDGLY